MRTRRFAMLALGIVVVLLVVLCSCANDGEVREERIKGHNCLVQRNGAGRVVAMSCDWGN